MVYKNIQHLGRIVVFFCWFLGAKIPLSFKKKGFCGKKRVMSPLVRGSNPRDPTKTLIFQNKAQSGIILLNKE